MASMMRSFTRVPRARFLPATASTLQPRRFAHQSYGNEMSGHEQGTNEKNPKQHLEHPGPKSPVEESGQSQGSSSSQQQQQQSQSSGSSSSSSSGGEPKILNPKSAAEEHDPEVKKHNEEMRNRADRSANQLSEKDNKVDKNFWKGDVGNIRGDQK